MVGLHAEREIDQSLDLLGDGAHLAIVPAGRDDERVEGVHQFAQVQHDRVNTQLLFGRDDRRVKQRRYVGRIGAARQLAARHGVTQRATPRTNSVGHSQYDQGGEEGDGQRGNAKDGVALFGASNMLTTRGDFKDLQC